MSDGSIVFDTKIDDSTAKDGYTKLVSNLKSQIRDLESEIKKAQGYSDDLRKGLEKSPNSSGLQKNLQKNETYLKQLRGEWDKLTNQMDSIPSTKSVVNGASTTSTDVSKSLVDTGTANNQANGVSRLANFFNDLKKKASGAGQAVKDFFDKGNKTDSLAKSLTKSIFSLGNMFKMLALRMVMRAAIKAVQEGFSNLVTYSNGVNNAFANAVASIKANGSSMINGLAVSIAPLVTVLAPVIDRITDAMLAASNAVARFFAQLTGQSSYTKAIKQAAKLEDANKKAAEAGKLASIDEVNDISQSSSSKSTDTSGMFQEEATGASETAEKAKALLDKIQTGFDILKGKIIDAWNANGNGEIIMGAIDGIVNDIYNWFSNILDITNEWLSHLDLTPFMTAFANFMTSCQPLLQAVGDIITWLYQTLVLPFGKWLIEQFFPAVLDLLASLNNFLSVLWFKVLKPVLDALMQYLGPIFSQIGDGVILILKDISKWITDITTWIENHQEEAKIIGAVIVGIILGISIVLFALNNPIGLIIAVVVAGIALIRSHWDDISNFFQTTVQDIQNAFRDCVNAVAGFFEGLFNGIISGLEWCINRIVDGINGILWPARQVLGWVGVDAPSFGYVDLPRVSIPRLATGTVVPPNAGEFAAILGDNKSETEVVSPLSTMKQALTEAMNENGTGNNSRIIQLLEILISVVENKSLLGDDVGKAAVAYANAEFDRTGEPVFKGV